MIQGIVVFKIRIVIYGIVGFEEYSDSWVRIKNSDSDIRNSWVRIKNSDSDSDIRNQK